MLRTSNIPLILLGLCLFILPLIYLSFTFKLNNNNRTVLKINQQELINIENSITDLTKQSIKLDNLVKQNKKTDYIRISSGGGHLKAGMQFIQRIKAAKDYKIVVVCFIDKLAASMALIIFSECSERYALYGSRIMWHSVAIMGCLRLNVFALKKLEQEIITLNNKSWKTTRGYFNDSFFEKHFEKETLVNVTTIQKEAPSYLKVLTKIEIPGIKLIISKKKTKQTKTKKKYHNLKLIIAPMELYKGQNNE